MSRSAILFFVLCFCASAPVSAALISTGGAASQSTTLAPQYGAENAINGIFSDFTHTQGDGVDPNTNWQLDLLGGDYNIDQVVIYNRGDGCCQSRLRDITVTIRNAANTATVYTSPLLNPENTLGGPGTLTVNPGVIGGIVIVARAPDPDLSGSGGGVVDNNDGYVLSLGEVQVFGSPVPEPSSIALLGTGLVGMGVAAWRRRKTG